jgi:transposase
MWPKRSWPRSTCTGRVLPLPTCRIHAVQHDTGQPQLMSFVRGVLADYDAVRAGLTLHHNSGPVEGNVNRIKMIKRKLYGRANFDLLRSLVVLGP